MARGPILLRSVLPTLRRLVPIVLCLYPAIAHIRPRLSGGDAQCPLFVVAFALGLVAYVSIHGNAIGDTCAEGFLVAQSRREENRNRCGRGGGGIVCLVPTCSAATGC